MKANHRSRHLKAIRADLERAADPKRAPKMEAYTKSEMLYHGVPVPEVRRIAKKIFDAASFDSFKAKS